MSNISSRKPYRIGRSRTGLGLFATREIPKGVDIVRYSGPLIDSKTADELDNRYLFEINGRWTIDGSTRKNVGRYANHSCKPNAESDVSSRKRRVMIRSIKTIQPGEEITYDYGRDYFTTFLKPIGCKCVKCEAKRKAERAEARAQAKRKKARAAKKAANGHAVGRPAKRARKVKTAKRGRVS
jgi:SET domain-containing protein